MMKMRMEFDCTPAEARAFLGLPDIAPLNEHLVAEMRKRFDGNVSALDPEAMMRSWMSLGGMAQDQLRSLMAKAVAGTAGSGSG